jgi:hypothetical protein
VAEHRYGRDTSGRPLDQRTMSTYRADLVRSAARVELELASHAFHEHRNRSSRQRLTRAITSYRSLSEDR